MAKKRKRAKPPEPPDLGLIMQHLNQGIALVTTAYRSLDADDADTAASPETITLKEGIAKLNEVYNDLDLADTQLIKCLEPR